MQHKTNDLSPNEYQIRAMSTMADQQKILDRMNEIGPRAVMFDNAVTGICNEAGEFSELKKNWLEYGRGEPDPEQVLLEAGDMVWRVCQALESFNLTLEQAMIANLKKLGIRYKTGEFTEHEANNRDRQAEDQTGVEVITKAIDSTTTLRQLQTYAGMLGVPDPGCIEDVDDLREQILEKLQNRCTVPAVILKARLEGNYQALEWDTDEKRRAIDEEAKRLHIAPQQFDDYPSLLQAMDGVTDKRLVQVLEQTGHGFAEPPMDEYEGFYGLKKYVEEPSVVSKRPLSNSYNRYCKVCGVVPVHRLNATQICPNCFKPNADKSATK